MTLMDTPPTLAHVPSGLHTLLLIRTISLSLTRAPSHSARSLLLVLATFSIKLPPLARVCSLTFAHDPFRSYTIVFALSRLRLLILARLRPILLTNTPSQLQKLLFACTRFLLARARFLLFGFAFLARAHSITHMHVPSRLHPPLLAHARLLSIAQAPSCSFMLPFAHAHFLPFRLCTLPLAHTYSSGYHTLLLAHICSLLFRTRSLMIAEAPSCSHLFLY